MNESNVTPETPASKGESIPAPNWMADSRPLLAEIAALSKQRDALAAALNKIITHARTYEVKGSIMYQNYQSDLDKENVALEFSEIAAAALAGLEVTP